MVGTLDRGSTICEDCGGIYEIENEGNCAEWGKEEAITTKTYCNASTWLLELEEANQLL